MSIDISNRVGITPRKRVKQLLKDREMTIGVNPQYPSSDLVEFIASNGIDLLFIDCEHGGPDVERVSDVTRAGHIAGAAVVLRPWSKDPGLLRRYLSCGIDGLIVPQYEGMEETLALRKIYKELNKPESEDMLLIALIESEAGYANLDEIVSSDIDAVLVGPADLAASYGLNLDDAQDQIRSMTFDIVERSSAAGKSAGAPLGRYGVEPTVNVGANLIIYFLRDILGEKLQSEIKILMELKR